MYSNILNSNSKIACCVLTHNHPQVIQDVLTHICHEYADHGIDMYICDDSDDDATKSIVDTFIQNGATNLVYVDAHVASSNNDKYVRVIQKEFLLKDYDYIWPCKDRIYYMGSVLDELSEVSSQSFDIIMIDKKPPAYKLQRQTKKMFYDNPVDFFYEHGVTATNWEGMIYNSKTILNLPNMSDFYTAYNINGSNSFNQPVTVFAGLAELTSPSVKIVNANYEDWEFSPFASSEWRSNIFNIWIDKWIPAIFSLPSIYDTHKSYIIKQETNLFELFGSVDNLINLYSEGILTKEVFDKYRGIWPSLSDIPITYIDILLSDDITYLLQMILSDFEDAFKKADIATANYLFIGNRWFSEYFDSNTYSDLDGSFYIYSLLRNREVPEDYFSSISSMQSFINWYKAFTNNQ